MQENCDRGCYSVYRRESHFFIGSFSECPLSQAPLTSECSSPLASPLVSLFSFFCPSWLGREDLWKSSRITALIYVSSGFGEGCVVGKTMTPVRHPVSRPRGFTDHSLSLPHACSHPPERSSSASVCVYCGIPELVPVLGRPLCRPKVTYFMKG